jgi:pyruvate dehydrogenase E2 component (dihydrolipoamide acetyltransferase)
MEEGTILKWHRQEGDSVKEGDVLLEIETDKAAIEVEAPTSGVLRKILKAEGEMIPIRQPIAILGSADEPIDALLSPAGATEDGPQSGMYSGTVSEQEKPEPRYPNPEPRTEGRRVFLSPRARRVADERGVPVAALAGRGTGPEGRVVERDVLAYLDEQSAQPVIAAPVATERPSPRATPLAARVADDLGVDLGDLALGPPGRRVRREDVLRHAETGAGDQGSQGRAEANEAPTNRAAGVSQLPIPPAPGPGAYATLALAGMRKRIAENVAKSKFTAPHVTLTLEVDMTETAAFRQRLIPEVEKAYGARLSYTDILVKASAQALDAHPMLNASLVGEEIRLYTQKNIGVAVALDTGLIAPVVKSAERKSLGSISAELKQLVERARTGRFTPDDLSDGTFTISNLGAFGIDVFDPIIVTGQAAILGVGRLAEKPVVVNKEVVVRTMMNLCLSFDHRILDGAPAARFLQRLKELLENPMLILI